MFCSAGKDRTGLVVGLVLSAVGVADEEVVGDYAKSEGSLSPEFRAELAARAVAAGFTRQPAVTAGAPAAIMRQTLASIRRRYGGTAEYLLGNGMSGDALALLRHALLSRG